MSETIQTKQCSKCKEIKPISEFAPRNNRPSGLQYHCRQCQKEYRQKPGSKKLQKKRIHKYRQTEKYHIAKKGQQAVYHAVKSGKLIAAKKLKCIYCGNTAKHYHHPNGYDKEHRFDIAPVCRKCHKNLHLITL